MNSISFNSVPVARLSLFGYEYVLWTLCCRETLNTTSPSLLNSSTITAIFINIILDSFFNQPVNSAFILFQSPVFHIQLSSVFMDALLFQTLNNTRFRSPVPVPALSCSVWLWIAGLCHISILSTDLSIPWRISPVPAPDALDAACLPLMPLMPSACP